MAEPFLCYNCERAEGECQCDQRYYCCTCQGQNNIRLCQDGQYYCLECREVCDLQAQY